MKKLALIILLLAGLSVSVVSCGGDSNDNDKAKDDNTEAVENILLKPSNISVSGKLGGFLEVEDKVYHVAKEDGRYKFSVSLKHNGGTPKISLDDVVCFYDAENSTKPLSGKFIIEILDENDNVVYSEDLGSDDFNKLLGLSKDEKVNVWIYCYGDLLKAKTFQISSVVKENVKKKEIESIVEQSIGDLNDDIETANKAIQATSEALGVIGSAAKAINELNELEELAE